MWKTNTIYIFLSVFVILLSCSNDRFKKTKQVGIEDETRYLAFVDSLFESNSSYESIKWIYTYPILVQKTEKIWREDEIQIPETFELQPFSFSNFEYSSYSFSDKGLSIKVLEPTENRQNLDSLFYSEFKKKGIGMVVTLPYSWTDSTNEVWIDYKVIEYGYCGFPYFNSSKYK
ncbi:hypothetical protein [Flammeovirga kamogawensis]|uniref:DUF4136 domain-containing protein n=1 Tax=Flammeovirga kamogawensis TaxID=373891 RepID=A0ABX8H2R4_9BACT|nr:hypothetical protein [Flammeovirga kamogawensis]MBB6464120.1 hypothetical protein [Flammeovirga kamogawensis]QWG09914.1 hypothetical protein KM029_19730 [Flammeovirga kamogawensis]TRX65424.1 hypothetical protein EO216_23155 [Flammeovirga kamogawensis]